MRPSKRVFLLAIPAAILVAAAALAFLSAQRAFDRSARAQLTAHQLGFTLTAIDVGSAGAQSAAFEPVADPAKFTAGVLLLQDAYLGGPAGLSVFGPDRTLRYSLRTGAELPVQPIIAVATARLRGAGDAGVLLATEGAGLLLLEPSPAGPLVLRQLLPAAPALRDLTALLPLPSGDLLLGTRHAGVLLYNGSTLTPLRFNLPGFDSSALEVTALAAPDAASVLIGTRNSGIFYLHGGAVAHADASNGLPDRQIEVLLVAGRKAYAGTPLGVAEFDLTAESFQPAQVIARGVFSHALALDAPAGRLWIGTLDQGVRPFSLTPAPRLHNASIVAPRGEPEPTSAQRIDEFLQPPGASAASFALADGALIAHSGGTWTAVQPAIQPAASAIPAALADRNISALAFAPDGSLYVGFFDHGLDIVAPGDHAAIRHLEDDHVFCVNRLLLDPERQTIAAATANGLVLFDRQGAPRQVLTRRDGLISDYVTDLAFTRAGLTLAAPAGLTFLGPDGAESLYAFQGLVNNHVYALGSTPGSDRLLAGTLGGLSLLEANSVRRNLTTANSGLKHNWVTAILPQRDGGYLIGTYGAGIQQLAPDGSFRTIDLPAGTPGNLIINPNAMLATAGHLYAGTLDHGLLVFSAASGRWYNIVRGLPSLNVTAFAERNGELYVGTENGLVRIAESKLEAQLQ